MFCEVSEIQFASKVDKFSFVSLRIFRILQLFTGYLEALCRQVYESDVGCFSSQKKRLQMVTKMARWMMNKMQLAPAL